MATGWVHIVIWGFDSLNAFSILCCSKGHQRKLSGHKTNKGFVIQQILDLWNVLKKDLVSGKSLHGSGR